MATLIHTFLGRASALARLKALPTHRATVLTITGPPGVGKTTLVLRFLEELEAAAIFVDLSEARTASALMQSMATALDVDIDQEDGPSASAAIAEAIARCAGGVLVLDNAEQIAESVGLHLAQWLEPAPPVRVLVTSRIPLGLEGELRLDLEPLTPALATQLFIDRARLRRPRYDPQPPERETIGELVAELDGIPLAVELAAGRMGLASPSQLLDRIRSRFDILRQRTPGVSPRHATMLAAIAWSWELLEPHERLALAQCSVFRGGFDLEAAEAVVLLALREAPLLIDVLHALQDHSLITIQREGDPLRLSLYLGIRDYAWEQLEDPRSQRDAVRRHAAYYARRCKAWSEATGTSTGPEALTRLALERENLLAVVERLHAMWREDPDILHSEDIEHWVLALTVFQYMQAHQEQLHAFRKAASDAVEAARVLPSGARVLLAALKTRAGFEHRLEERAQAFRTFEELLVIAEQTDNPSELSAALIGMANRYRIAGELERSREAYERALEIERSLGDEEAVGLVIMNLGVLDNDRDRLQAAAERFDQAIDIFTAIDQVYLLVYALANRAGILAAYGEIDAALHMMQRSLKLHERTGEAGVHMRLLGVVLKIRVQGGAVTAEERELLQGELERAVERCQEMGERLNEAYLQAGLGDFWWDHGQLEPARRCYARALRLNRDSHHELKLEGLLQLGLGLTYWDEPISARSHLQTARSIFERNESWRHVTLVDAMLCALCVASDDLPTALEHARSLSALEGASDTLARASALYGGLLQLREGRAEAIREPMLDALRPDARAVKGTVTRREPMFTSIYIRHALRVLDAALPAEARRRIWNDVLDPTGECLLMDDEAGYLRGPGGGDWVDLGRRPQLLRFFHCLLEHHRAHRGDYLELVDLIERAWPDERILYEAALNRVYKAVSTLRKMGLKPILQRKSQGGYRLDPDARILHLPPRGQLLANRGSAATSR